MAIAESLPDRKRNLIFINVVISCCAASILQTALNTALATITVDLNITQTTAQWLVSGYSLAMGIVMPLTAFLIRRVKTKNLYLFGLCLFIIGLVIDIFAPNFAILLFGRVFQGCGNGILIAMTQVVILSIFPPSKQGTAMGWYGLAVSAMPAIAPTLGGVLVETTGWRTIFLLVLAVLVFALVMALFVFENVLETSKISLDMPSFILSIFAFGGLTLGVGNVSEYGIRNPFVYIPLIVGAVTMVIYIRRQLNHETPFLDFKILRIREVSLGVVASMVLYFVLMGSSVLVPLYVQNVEGATAVIAGLVTLPGSICMAVISPFSGRIYDRMGIKRLFVLGSALLIISSVLMFTLRESQPLALAAVYCVIRYIAIGLMMMPLITWGTTHAGKEKMADASAMLSALRTIGGAVGTAVFVGIMSAVALRLMDQGTADTSAHMRGMNIAFLVMAFVSCVLLFMAIFLVKGENTEAAESETPDETAAQRQDKEVVEAVESSPAMEGFDIAEKAPQPGAMEILEEEAEEKLDEETESNLANSSDSDE